MLAADPREAHETDGRSATSGLLGPLQTSGLQASGLQVAPDPIGAGCECPTATVRSLACAICWVSLGEWVASHRAARCRTGAAGQACNRTVS
jgi:hypothetical protein